MTARRIVVERLAAERTAVTFPGEASPSIYPDAPEAFRAIVEWCERNGARIAGMTPTSRGSDVAIE